MIVLVISVVGGEMAFGKKRRRNGLRLNGSSSSVGSSSSASTTTTGGFTGGFTGGATGGPGPTPPMPELSVSGFTAGITLAIGGALIFMDWRRRKR